MMPAHTSKRIHALWCHPRCMSTAFERIMRERGDLDVLHEPFMYHYYDAGQSRTDGSSASRTFANFEPDPAHPVGYTAIRQWILTRALAQAVFLKDMAYYVLDELQRDPEFCAALTHTFLIRDPAASVVSYQRLDPDFVCEEVGVEAQWHLYEHLQRAGLRPTVIDADAVRADPAGQLARYCEAVGLAPRPDALTWSPTVPDEWHAVRDWHTDAIQSGAIRPPETARDVGVELEALGSPYVEFAAHHRPYYERLLAEAL